MRESSSTSTRSEENLSITVSAHPLAVDGPEFVIIPNLEMKTLRPRELIGLTPVLGARSLKASAVFHRLQFRSQLTWVFLTYLPRFLATRPLLPPSKLPLN